jgi:hypothetical protein
MKGTMMISENVQNQQSAISNNQQAIRKSLDTPPEAGNGTGVVMHDHAGLAQLAKISVACGRGEQVHSEKQAVPGADKEPP